MAMVVNNFESNTKRLLNSKTLKSLYNSDKWEISWWNRSANSHDPKYKDHRRGMYDFRSTAKVN
jgi:hypothetical protein